MTAETDFSANTNVHSVLLPHSLGRFHLPSKQRHGKLTTLLGAVSQSGTVKKNISERFCFCLRKEEMTAETDFSANTIVHSILLPHFFVRLHLPSKQSCYTAKFIS